VWQGDALALVPGLPGPYDLVFLDPPFADALHERALTAVLEHSALAPEGLVYLEYPANTRPELPEALEVLREKGMGSVEATLARATNIKK
jgi:16S rRNA (guanine966-N2)-methyltransferase